MYNNRLNWSSCLTVLCILQPFVAYILSSFLLYFVDLNEFMSRLDERYTQKVSREGGTVAKKVRRNGAPTRSPPKDAADWTIDAGMYMYAECTDLLFTLISMLCRVQR